MTEIKVGTVVRLMNKVSVNQAYIIGSNHQVGVLYEVTEISQHRIGDAVHNCYYLDHNTNWFYTTDNIEPFESIDGMPAPVSLFVEKTVVTREPRKGVVIETPWLDFIETLDNIDHYKIQVRIGPDGNIPVALTAEKCEEFSKAFAEYAVWLHSRNKEI